MTDDGTWPPPNFAEYMHDLLADIRAVATALTDSKSNFVLNLELGTTAFGRGPEHAVVVIAQIASLRLHQIDQALEAQGREPMPFPREELLDRLPPSTVVPDCIDYLEQLVETEVPERAPIDELIRRHGVLAFMMLVQIANEVGKMLADVDPNLSSFEDLFSKEALADELPWLNGADTDAS